MCCSPNVCMCCVVRALRCDLLPAGRVGGECLCMCVFVYVSACVCECVCVLGCGGVEFLLLPTKPSRPARFEIELSLQ